MKILRFLVAGILLAFVASMGFFLWRSDDKPVSVQIELHSDPFPMVIGPTDLIVSLKDSHGMPIEGADVYVITQHMHHGAPPITDTARRYEDGHYYIPVLWSMMGQASVIVYANLPDGETVEEEFMVFVYFSPLYGVDNQGYRSEREIKEELANVPDNEYWIVVPQGAREITGMHFEDFVPSLISLSVSTKNTLVIRNDDFVDNSIGPFYVRAGETLRQRFDEPGVYQGTCTINQGPVRIEVGE